MILFEVDLRSRLLLYYLLVMVVKFESSLCSINLGFSNVLGITRSARQKMKKNMYINNMGEKTGIITNIFFIFLFIIFCTLCLFITYMHALLMSPWTQCMHAWTWGNKNKTKTQSLFTENDVAFATIFT